MAIGSFVRPSVVHRGTIIDAELEMMQANLKELNQSTGTGKGEIIELRDVYKVRASDDERRVTLGRKGPLGH